MSGRLSTNANSHPPNVVNPSIMPVVILSKAPIKNPIITSDMLPPPLKTSNAFIAPSIIAMTGVRTIDAFANNLTTLITDGRRDMNGFNKALIVPKIPLPTPVPTAPTPFMVPPAIFAAVVAFIGMRLVIQESSPIRATPNLVGFDKASPAAPIARGAPVAIFSMPFNRFAPPTFERIVPANRVSLKLTFVRLSATASPTAAARTPGLKRRDLKLPSKPSSLLLDSFPLFSALTLSTLRAFLSRSASISFSRLSTSFCLSCSS